MSTRPAEVVEGRACGQCTLCCKLMWVSEIDKAGGTWCQHVEQGKGCGIYADRPQSCRTFQCGYMTTAELGPEWYPARSKIVLSSKETGLTVLVDASRPDAWRTAPFYAQIKTWARLLIPKGQTMLVRVGTRCFVILPDEDVDVGNVTPADEVFLDTTPGPVGPIYRVRTERKVPA